MNKVIVVHSYKGGTGKTSLSVNLAATFAKQGKKVAVFDLDFRAPSLFAVLQCEKAKTWLNDFLNDKCSINKVLIDLSSRLSTEDKFYVGPANPSTEAIRDMAIKDRKWEMRALHRMESLKENLIDDQKFDYIIFDTSPGLQYSSMNGILVADFIALTTTGDCSDVNGTKRMLSDFYNIFEKKTGLVLNKVVGHQSSENAALAQKVREEYKVPLLGVLPCFCEVIKAQGKYIFPQDKPNHEFSCILAEIATKIEKNEIN